MQLEFKTQNHVFHIILRVKCQEVSVSGEKKKPDETPSRVFDTSLQSKLMTTVLLNDIFFLRFGNDCNDLIEVSCNLQMTSLDFPWNIARLNVF